MPRIYTSQNDPLDFCNYCFPSSEDEAYTKYGGLGDNPDDPERGNCFGYDAEHPDYVSEGYSCYICKEPLQDTDN